MIKKLLVANRGEIAVRIIRTCRDLGISVVAVYSDADRGALHVRMADEAYPIGGAAARESYLDVEAVVGAARRSGADAIHPGYGFLSENPALPEACAQSGITFVGPSAGAMRRIGEKTSARTIAREVGVPIVPGTTSSARSLEEIRASAALIGYPVLLKAAAGGGGKGMRPVHSEGQLADAFRAASSEAKASFGDGSVYLEKFLEHPRHIEVQILADHAGDVFCVGERDCSIQRRHQKLIEETPSPAVGPEMRSKLFDAASRVARAVGYENAGTAEFLVDGDNYYFLEMNARLQVEHPVTEEATGLDLVKEQLGLAAGDTLERPEARMQTLRHAAIECRIYAEDPYNQFLPSIGRISALQQPGGPNVRVESASFPGMEVGLHYDPLLAKLITRGATRDDAIHRMRRALSEYVVLGIRTSIPFHRFAMNDEVFLEGSYNTRFVERWIESAPRHEHLMPIAAAAAAYLESRRTGQRPADSALGGPPHDGAASVWGMVGRRAVKRWE